MVLSTIKYTAFPILCISLIIPEVLTKIPGVFKYGESCISETHCDSAALLKCNQGTCGCFDPNTMTYNGTSCVVLALQFCLTMDKLLVKDNEEYHKLPCVSKATCSLQNPICNCVHGYHVGADFSCKPKLHGTKCNLDSDCGSATNLVCNENKHCECKQNVSSYDNYSNQCLGTTGAPCDEYGKECSPTATCSHGTCSCRPEYQFVNQKGECEWRRGFNESCEQNSQCEDKFNCNSTLGTCDCRTLQIYEASEKTCVGLAGGLCFEQRYPKDPLHYEAECIANAECGVVSSNAKSKKCRCKVGYTTSANGVCFVAHGNKCGGKEFCNEGGQGTVCFEGKCQCKTGQIFDGIRNKCVGQLHSRCDETAVCAEDTNCAAAAVNEIGKGQEDLKHCVCNPGLVPVDNNCHPAIGQPCDYLPEGKDTRKPSRICDPLTLSLHCINGACNCGHMQFYDQTAKQCKGLVGSYCEMNIRNYCTSNADCVLVRSIKPKRGMCKCRSGWKTGKDGTCIK